MSGAHSIYLTHKILKKIQIKFLKHLNCRSQHMYVNYEESCEFHKCLSLEDRRKLLDMLFLYKVCHGTIDSTVLTESFVQLRALLFVQDTRLCSPSRAFIPIISKIQSFVELKLTLTSISTQLIFLTVKNVFLDILL